MAAQDAFSRQVDASGVASTAFLPQRAAAPGWRDGTYAAFDGTPILYRVSGGLHPCVVVHFHGNAEACGHVPERLARSATVIAVDRPGGVLSRPGEAGVDGLPPDPKLYQTL